MLTIDDVTATPEVGATSPLCRRSSASSDNHRASSGPGLTRSESFKGSSSSLTTSWRRESIVEALDKKCRESVSSRLRSQLPQHLQRPSTGAISDLPVIVRPASRGSLAAGGTALPRPSRRASTQHYQDVIDGAVLPIRLAARRHSTTAAASPTNRWGRSLSNQGPDDLLDRPRSPPSAWSTLERPSTDPDLAGDSSKWSTLPTRLKPDFDSLEEQRTPSGGYYTESTSSAETFNEDRKADFDENPDFDDEGSCDEVSVESFTFSPTTSSEPSHEPSTSYPALLDRSAATGADLSLKEVPKVHDVHRTSPYTCRTEFQMTKPADIQNASNKTRAPATDTKNVARVSSTGIGLTNGTSDKTLGTRPCHISPQVVEPESVQPTTQRASLSSGVQQNGQEKAGGQVLSFSSRTADDIGTEEAPKPTTSGNTDDRPRYRTTFSLAISSPHTSTSSCKPKPRQEPSEQVEDPEDSFPPPPPLPVSAAPTERVDWRSLEGWSPDDVVDRNPRRSTRDETPTESTTQFIWDIDNTILTSPNQHDSGTPSVTTSQTSTTNMISEVVPDSKWFPIITRTFVANTSTKPIPVNSGSGTTDQNFPRNTNQMQDEGDATLNSIDPTVHKSGSTSSVHDLGKNNGAIDEPVPTTSGPISSAPCRGKKNSAAETGFVNGQPVSVVVLGQSENARNHFNRQVNGFHTPAGDQVPCRPNDDGFQSYRNDVGGHEDTEERAGWCTVTSRTETALTSSFDRKSVHVTSGLPVNVVETRTTERATVIPVRVQRQTSWSGLSQPPEPLPDEPGPSVDRSWEILRTDSTRAAVVPYRITKSQIPVTTRPQESRQSDSARPPVVVIPVKHADFRRRSSGPPDASRSLIPRSTSLDHSPSRHAASRYRRDDVPDTMMLDVDVIKSGLALGFSIDGGRDSLFGDRPLTVKRVFREDEKLRAGDEILSANGRPLNDLSHFVALNFLKSLPDGPVHLVLRRHYSNN